LKSEVGLSVCVTGEKENLDFLREVRIRAAFISRLDRGEDLHLLNPETLEVLKCVGFFNTEWFRCTVMPECPFLRNSCRYIIFTLGTSPKNQLERLRTLILRVPSFAANDATTVDFGGI
jgi:hypothetical protein